MPQTYISTLLVAVLCSIHSAESHACPFCQAVKNTMSEEMASVEAVLVTRLVSSSEAAAGDPSGSAKAKFEIVEALKGAKYAADHKTIETAFFGDAVPGKLFLIYGVDAANIQWTVPLAITDRGYDYIRKLSALPAEGKDRLAFFQDYFEDADPMLAGDAYDEFAKASYSAVKDLRASMHRDKLLAHIQDKNVSVSHRRLYLTMLGVCGTPAEIPLLETMLRDAAKEYRAGLDAMIACYLNLRGPQGLDLVDELFLSNAQAEYADIYSAVMALRFHATETELLPQERILKSFHHLLARPMLADLVIPDLARMEDWTAVDKLVELFKNANEKNNWVRVPVINYLRACPLPEAEKHLVELEKLDPKAVKRANTWFPVTPSAAPRTTEPAKSSQSKYEELELQAMAMSNHAPLPPPDEEAPVASMAPMAAPVPLTREFRGAGANPWGLGGVLLIAAASLALVTWSYRRRATMAPAG